MDNQAIYNTEAERLRVSNFAIRIVVHILLYAIIVISIVTVSNKAYDFTYQIYGNVKVSTMQTKKEKFEIKQGDSNYGIAEALYKKGLIVNKYSFFIRLKLSQRIIQPGKYDLTDNMTYKEIIEEISPSGLDEE